MSAEGLQSRDPPEICLTPCRRDQSGLIHSNAIIFGGDSSQDDSVLAWWCKLWQIQWVYSLGQNYWDLQVGLLSAQLLQALDYCLLVAFVQRETVTLSLESHPTPNEARALASRHPKRRKAG